MASARPPAKRRRMAAHDSTQAEVNEHRKLSSWHTLIQANARAPACIFEFCTVADMLALRLVSKCMLECVTTAERSAMSLEQTEKTFDKRPHRVKVWRQMFPHWRVLSLAYTRAHDGAMRHLGRVESLDLSCCHDITDAAFPYLKGVRHLNLWALDQACLTDASFMHFKRYTDTGYQ
jgi:hypothetical protein